MADAGKQPEEHQPQDAQAQLPEACLVLRGGQGDVFRRCRDMQAAAGQEVEIVVGIIGAYDTLNGLQQSAQDAVNAIPEGDRDGIERTFLFRPCTNASEAKVEPRHHQPAQPGHEIKGLSVDQLKLAAQRFKTTEGITEETAPIIQLHETRGRVSAAPAGADGGDGKD